mgnify:CR=1 FL=1
MDPEKLFPALCTLALILCAGCAGQGQPKPADTQVPQVTPSAQIITTTVPPAKTITATPVPTTPDNRYPNALRLKSAFTFGNATSWTSEAALTRIWINDTYRWYNPAEHQYETRVAPAGKKFLFQKN